MFAEMWNALVVRFYDYLPKIIYISVILIVGAIIIKIITSLVERFFNRMDFDRAAETFIEGLVRFVLWIILIIVVLSNFGINVSALLAGLGIMGIVIGFALQDTLGNFAAGIFILFYKPFKVGDWINIGGTVGGVQRIGIAACTLNSPDNIKITIPNGKIWKDTIKNYTGNKVRKIFDLVIGISYGDDIGKAMDVINSILKKDPRILKDPLPQVIVKDLGDSSVNIGVRPAVKKEDYWAVKFDLTRKIKEEFDKKGISIPFPQRDVWMKK